MSRRKKKNSKGLPIVVFVVIFFSVCAGVYCLTLMNQKSALQKRQDRLERQMESEEKRAAELETLEKYMQTKKYMEEVAREKLGLVYPDEILIEPSNK